MPLKGTSPPRALWLDPKFSNTRLQTTQMLYLDSFSQQLTRNVPTKSASYRQTVAASRVAIVQWLQWSSAPADKRRLSHRQRLRSALTILFKLPSGL